MKKAFIYLILSVYTFVSIKPLIVFADDVLAHTFWRVQHMATVHYENGHYHLHNELKEISEKENTSSKEKTPSAGKTIEMNVHDIKEFNFKFKPGSEKENIAFNLQQDLVPGHTKIYSPPPKQATRLQIIIQKSCKVKVA